MLSNQIDTKTSIHVVCKKGQFDVVELIVQGF